MRTEDYALLAACLFVVIVDHLVFMALEKRRLARAKRLRQKMPDFFSEACLARKHRACLTACVGCANPCQCWCHDVPKPVVGTPLPRNGVLRMVGKGGFE